MKELTLDILTFARFMLRPRAIRAWWRLGSFDCMCWSFDYARLEYHARTEAFLMQFHRSK